MKYLLILFCITSMLPTIFGQQPSPRTEDSLHESFIKTKFVPPPGQTLIIMGQTKERIVEYWNTFGEEPSPGGWSAYWAINTDQGLRSPFRNPAGNTQDHQFLVDSRPNAVISSALWMVGNWDIAKKTKKGTYDWVIDRFAAWAKSVNRPIYLRIGYEFDGPHNALPPKLYVKAYRHIVDRLTAAGVSNVAYVWHSYGQQPYKAFEVSEWYPGDDYVHWVGLSLFEIPYHGTDFGPYGDQVVAFAEGHHKPLMIAEASPIKGIGPAHPEALNWLENLFTICTSRNVKALALISENWPTQNIPGISHWGDARIQNDLKFSKRWFQEINKDRYLKATPELFELLNPK